MIAPLEELVERFPALEGLRRAALGRVPHVQQAAAADCGAACLAMVLQYHGRQASLAEVRDVLGVGRDGTSAQMLVEGGEWYGLRGRGIRVEDPRDLVYVERAAVLHWNLDHFVVLDHAHRDGVVVVDPGHGRRSVGWKQVEEAFSGVAVELVPGEGFQRGDRRPDPLWRLLGSMLADGRLWRRVVVVSVLLQLLALAVPVVVGVVVDRVVPLHDTSMMGVVALGALAVVGFQLLTTLVRGQLLLQARIALDARLTVGFLDHLVELPYGFFETRTESDLLMRINSATTLREILTSGLLSAVIDGSMVLLLLGSLLIVSPTMAAVAGLAGLAQIAVMVVTWRRQRELVAETLQREVPSQGFQLEMLRGMETLKAMGLERRALGRWSNLYVELLNAHLRKGELSTRYEAVAAAVRVAGPLLVLWTGAWLVLDSGLSLGAMLAGNAIAAGLLGPLSTLVETARQAQLFTSWFDRIRDVLAAAPEASGGERMPIGPLAGRIELERVGFRYSRSSGPVLDDLSLTIEPGELVAIVGRSGAGKSTLARLVLGLVTPTAGRVRIDGADLAAVELRSVRRQVGLVAQTPVVLGQTIRENLQIAAPDAPFEELVAAARLARIHDDIAAMPMGYDTVLANGGAMLSGGQRQRVALARALVRRPAILVLDEATSALDAVTEAAVHEQLERLACTRLIVAHRLSTVMRADRIVVLEHGRIAEVGTHQELLRAGGIYAELVSAQLGA